jgi:hypothetical protein
VPAVRAGQHSATHEPGGSVPVPGRWNPEALTQMSSRPAVPSATVWRTLLPTFAGLGDAAISTALDPAGSARRPTSNATMTEADHDRFMPSPSGAGEA